MLNNNQEKRKPVNVELIPADNEAWGIMRKLIAEFHTHLAEAKIALAWNYGWSKDADGITKLGQCKKVSDLDKEFHENDFVILLNFEAWQDPEWTYAQKVALIDHELCHAQVSLNDRGDPKHDERGRIVYRIAKHDIEEFNVIVNRHGIWKKDLEAFAATLAAKRKAPLLEVTQPKQSKSKAS